MDMVMIQEQLSKEASQKKAAFFHALIMNYGKKSPQNRMDGAQNHYYFHTNKVEIISTLNMYF